MAWNEPGGNKQDPWGGGNRGNGGPPDLDEVMKNLKDKVGKFFGGTGGSSGGSGAGVSSAGVGLVIMIVVLVYLGFGVKLIDASEKGVVLRLGVFHRIMEPGLNWAPPGIDSVVRVNVELVRTHTVTNVPMLTGDLNIVEVDLSVQYRIADVAGFVLNVKNPVESLEQATDSALRHVVGAMEMHEVLTEGRSQMASDVELRLQEYLDIYQTGIFINTVNVEETTPPREVQSAFDDVNRAREDEEREKNLAQAYANDVIPQARGSAQRMVEEATAYREQVIAEASGDAARFNQLYLEYKKAPKVTRERMYLDAVQEVMGNSSKILVDVEGGNNLLYLPLDQLVKQPPGGAIQNDRAQNSQIIELQREVERLRSELNSNSSRRGR